jgi:hypothetical protein
MQVLPVQIRKKILKLLRALFGRFVKISFILNLFHPNVFTNNVYKINYLSVLNSSKINK